MSVELEEVRDFLANHEPFAHLPQEELEKLSTQWLIQYVREGEQLVTAGQPNDHLYLIRSGAVDVLDSEGVLLDRRDVGQSFGYSTLVAENRSQYTMVTVEDCLLLQLDRAQFSPLAEAYPAVARYYSGLSARIKAAADQLRQGSGSDVLRTHLGEFAIKDPASAPSTTTLQQAAQQMNELRVSSLLIIDDGELAGIITDRDMRNCVANTTPVATPVAEVMPTKLETANSETVVFEAMLRMAELDIHHLPIVDDGRVTGIITAADVMRLLEHDPIYLTGEFSHAETPEDMAPIYRSAHEVAVRFIDRGASAEEVQALLSVAADTMARRLLTLAEQRFGPPPVPYAFVVVGSHGRREMGLASDQDNALILSDSYDANLHHDYFQQLADFVCQGLATAGQILCPGDMMASNPQWRMTLSQWRHTFHQWITAPEPDALLWAQTFFDMRSIHGDKALAQAVHAQAVESAAGASRMHAHLAALATRWEPPLGVFRGFAVDRRGEYANTLNIKKGGLAACVQMARLFGINAGRECLGTRARLEHSAGESVSRRGAEDLLDAFDFISDLTLRNQAKQFRRGDEISYHIDPADLSKMERENLRDAFQIIKKTQNGLAVRYPVRNI